MALTVLAVGKKHESWVVEGIERYQKRLRAPFHVEWLLIPHSSLEGDSARQEESERIISKLKPTDFVILLDERGSQLDSPALAVLLETQLAHSASIVFVIGGAYGVDARVHTRAQTTWSLSPLVFPHQMVRLILTEQVYRAQQITHGSSYHHE
jgi:23S rRNA (pseudouridine1915-N3)-methyltransferase